jgi:hypothetical protein
MATGLPMSTKARLERLRQDDAARSIQAVWRGKLARKRYKALLEGENDARSALESLNGLDSKRLGSAHSFSHNSSRHYEPEVEAAVVEAEPVDGKPNSVISSVKEPGGAPLSPKGSVSASAAQSEEEDEAEAVQDPEELRRDVQAARSEMALIRMSHKTPSFRQEIWHDIPELDTLQDGTQWPVIDAHSESVFRWVAERGVVLARAVTWNLQALPPPPVEETIKKLLPRNK